MEKSLIVLSSGSTSSTGTDSISVLVRRGAKHALQHTRRTASSIGKNDKQWPVAMKEHLHSDVEAIQK